MRSQKKLTPLLSLIIPVYNESRRIEKGLQQTIKYLSIQNYSWEIIVVNDGSYDNTKSLIAKFPVNSISTGNNFGKGHAIRVGVEAAKGKYIVFSDIDLSVSLNHLPLLLKELQSHQVVISSRKLTDSAITRHQKKLREFFGQTFTWISNTMLGLHHSDLTCGFKGFTKEAAKRLFANQQINDWSFDAEILFLTKKYSYSVKEIPVRWENNPLTKVNPMMDSIVSLIGLIKIRCFNALGLY